MIRDKLFWILLIAYAVLSLGSVSYATSTTSIPWTYFRWAPASGNPDGYEVFACVGDNCVYYTKVVEPRAFVGGQRWRTVLQGLNTEGAYIKVRGYRCTYGEMSEPSDDPVER